MILLTFKGDFCILVCFNPLIKLKSRVLDFDTKHFLLSSLFLRHTKPDFIPNEKCFEI